ncbi:pyridoxamine 5'-phosphate oxidase family protein [Clostridiaceae bacterium 35-E11]
MNKQMSPSELERHILDFLKEHKSAALATCMNNIPRSSPVQYFMGKDMEMYILSAGGEKFKAIAQNPNVCLLVNTEYINYRQIKGVQVFGQAVTSMDKIDLYQEAQAYCPEPYLMEHERDNLKVIKIIPKEIVYLDALEKGDRTKQVLKTHEVVLQ